MNTSLQNFQRGQSTVELMAAIFIFTIAMAGIAAVIFGNQFLSLDGEMNNIGVAKAQDLLEQQRANGKNNFYGVVAGVTTDGPYTKTVIVNDLNQCQKEVTSKIAWSTNGGAPKQITLTTLINNLAEELAHGGQCSGQNTNNPALTCPASVLSIGQPIDTFQAIDSTYATGVKVVNNTVYISAMPQTSGDNSQKDFWKLNVDSSYTFTVDRGNSISTGSGGLNALDVAGNYAYAASANGSAQLQVINISTIPPQVVATLALPSNSSPALSIVYRSGKVYIGTAASTGSEFFVVDVSNPLSPSVLGQYEVGGTVNKINVIGSSAYLATSNSSKQVIQLDITNANNPTEIFALSPSGSVGGQSLYFLGSKLFVGSLTGSNPNFNILNLANFSNLGSAYLPNLESTVTGKPNALLATGNLAFVGTEAGSDNRGKFMAINVTNPATPSYCPGSVRSFTNASVMDMEFQNGLVYLVVKNNLPLKIMRLTY